MIVSSIYLISGIIGYKSFYCFSIHVMIYCVTINILNVSREVELRRSPVLVNSPRSPCSASKSTQLTLATLFSDLPTGTACSQAQMPPHQTLTLTSTSAEASFISSAAFPASQRPPYLNLVVLPSYSSSLFLITSLLMTSSGSVDLTLSIYLSLLSSGNLILLITDVDHSWFLPV